MSGKSYSAGTIFLSVVPVFRDVQRDIKDYVGGANQHLADEMEKGGREAGKKAGKALGEEIAAGAEKAGKDAGNAYAGSFETRVKSAVKSAQKELDSINLSTASDKTLRDFDRVEKKLKELSEQDFSIDFNAKRVVSEIEVLEGTVRSLLKTKHELNISANLIEVQKDLAKVKVAAEKVVKDQYEINFGVNTKQVERTAGALERSIRKAAQKAADAIGDSLDPELRRIRKEFQDMAEVEIGIDMKSGEALRRLDELGRAAHRLSLNSPEIDVKVGAGQAHATIATLAAEVRALNGQEINIKADIDAGAAVAKAGLLRTLIGGHGQAGAEATANAFRSFNGVVLAAVTLLPALIPIIGGVGGALLGLLPILGAVGAGIGAMGVGFSGIGDAVQALGDQADSAAKDSNAAGKTIRSASYAVADAKTALADAERSAARAAADGARQVADARRAAAEAIEDALDRQRDAQEAYRDSVKDVQDAERDLREARKRAVEELKRDQDDTADKLRQNQLDIREAVLAAFDATNNFNQVMADGSSTRYDKEAAEVAMLQARERLHELRDTQRDLRDESKKQTKEGVRGNTAVQSAQDRLIAAVERQKDAQERLGEAAEAVHEARVDGARRVADAVRSQQRAEEDGARAVARAQENLRRANEQYGQALYDTGEIGSASMQKLEEAMGKLSPAGRDFALFLFGLRDNFRRLRDEIQTAMLPAVQRSFEQIINRYGPQFRAFMVSMATVIGALFLELARSLQGPAWTTFFGIMEKLGPRMLREFGMATINWLEVFANLMIAVAPFAERMSAAMLRLSEAAARWSASEKGQRTITSFMEYAERVGPAVIDFLSSFVRAAINLGKALAPWGELILRGLTALFDWIAALDPKVLGVIAGAIIGLVIAFQLAVGAVALIAAGATVFATTIGTVIFSVLAAAALIAVLAIRFERVRDLLVDIGGWFRQHADTLLKIAGVVLAVYAAYKLWLWITKAIAIAQFALNLVMRANPLSLIITGIVLLIAVMVVLYKKNETFRNIVNKVWRGVVAVFRWAMDMMKKAWDSVLKPVIDAIAEYFTMLWEEAIRPYLELAFAFWTKVFEAMKWAWTTILKPVLSAVRDAIVWLWKKAVYPYLKLVVAFWRSVFQSMKKAWNNILSPVIQLIFALFKWLWIEGVKRYLNLIKAAFRLAFEAMKWAWRNILKPVLDDALDGIRWLWEKAGKPVFEDLKKGFRKVGDFFKWVWRTLLKPIFDRFMEALGGRQGLQKKVNTVVDAIKKVWGGLKKIFGEPIKFVINTVIRDGLVKGFNKVAKFLKTDQIEFDGVDWNFAKGGVFGGRGSYATGGVLPGYTPGHDVHHFTSPSGGRLNLSGGEAIMRPEFTAAMSPAWVNQMNSIARAEGVRGIRRRLGEHSFFNGGVLPLDFANSIRQHGSGYPFAAWAGDLNSPYDLSNPPAAIRAWRAGRVNHVYHGYGDSHGRYGNHLTIDHGGQSSLYAHLSSIMAAVGQMVRAGQMIGRVGSTGNSTGAHLHFEIRGGTITGGENNQGDGSDGGWNPAKILKKFPGWLVDIAKNPIGYVKDLVKGPMERFRDAYDNSAIVDMIEPIPGKLVNGVKDKIVDILPGPLKKAAGAVGKGIKAAGAGLDAITPGDGVPGFARGGILPYNGTMMYDAGGYLPPGLTTVVNLTGKPEPVFTNEQFDQMGRQGGGFTYAPTLNGTDLTPEDLMDDLEFTYRKMKRAGSVYEDVL